MCWMLLLGNLVMLGLISNALDAGKLSDVRADSGIPNDGGADIHRNSNKASLNPCTTPIAPVSYANLDHKWLMNADSNSKVDEVFNETLGFMASTNSYVNKSGGGVGNKGCLVRLNEKLRKRKRITLRVCLQKGIERGIKIAFSFNYFDYPEKVKNSGE
nr:hypothetical protein [Tanacetum cinerariifolium]